MYCELKCIDICLKYQSKQIWHIFHIRDFQHKWSKTITKQNLPLCNAWPIATIATMTKHHLRDTCIKEIIDTWIFFVAPPQDLKLGFIIIEESRLAVSCIFDSEAFQSCETWLKKAALTIGLVPV